MANYPFNSSIPAAANNPSDDQPDMLINNQSTESLLGEDHISFNENNGGYHTAIHFDQTTSYVPTPPVSPPQLFTNTVAGLPQLFYYSGDSTHSSTQYVASGNGSTFLLGGIIIKWGQFTASNAGPTNVSFTSAFPNNCYSVTLTFSSTGASSSILRLNSTSVSGFVVPAMQGNPPIYYMAIGN